MPVDLGVAKEPLSPRSSLSSREKSSVLGFWINPTHGSCVRKSGRERQGGGVDTLTLMDEASRFEEQALLVLGALALAGSLGAHLVAGVPWVPAHPGEALPFGFTLVAGVVLPVLISAFAMARAGGKAKPWPFQSRTVPRQSPGGAFVAGAGGAPVGPSAGGYNAAPNSGPQGGGQQKGGDQQEGGGQQKGEEKFGIRYLPRVPVVKGRVVPTADDEVCAVPRISTRVRTLYVKLTSSICQAPLFSPCVSTTFPRDKVRVALLEARMATEFTPGMLAALKTWADYNKGLRALVLQFSRARPGRKGVLTDVEEAWALLFKAAAWRERHRVPAVFCKGYPKADKLELKQRLVNMGVRIIASELTVYLDRGGSGSGSRSSQQQSVLLPRCCTASLMAVPMLSEDTPSCACACACACAWRAQVPGVVLLRARGSGRGERRRRAHLLQLHGHRSRHGPRGPRAFTTLPPL